PGDDAIDVTDAGICGTQHVEGRVVGRAVRAPCELVEGVALVDDDPLSGDVRGNRRILNILRRVDRRRRLVEGPGGDLLVALLGVGRTLPATAAAPGGGRGLAGRRGRGGPLRGCEVSRR